MRATPRAWRSTEHDLRRHCCARDLERQHGKGRAGVGTRTRHLYRLAAAVALARRRHFVAGRAEQAAGCAHVAQIVDAEVASAALEAGRAVCAVVGEDGDFELGAARGAVEGAA